MLSGFSTIVCALPAQSRSVTSAGHRVAHMAYHVGPGLSLWQDPMPSPRGGFLMLDDEPYDRSPGDAAKLAQTCLSLCHAQGFEGLICDFEQPVRKTLEAFVAQGAELFTARGLTFYVPERYAACHGGTKVYVSTAMASGSLRARLSESAELYGAHRLALDMERVCRDIVLPAPTGMGTALGADRLAELLAERGGSSFFSSELCARYFTSKDDAGRTHFILFDDASTFRHKTSAAQALGIRTGLVLYPDAAALGIV